MADVTVSPGNTLQVEYIVENFGDSIDTQSVELVRTDTDTVVDSVTGIQLDAGNIDTGALLWDTGGVAEGTYNLTLSSNDDGEDIEVLVGVEDYPTLQSIDRDTQVEVR